MMLERTEGTAIPMRVALLGAGFTRNWGGWLASELLGELCGRVEGDVELLRLLKQTRNFERVLGTLRQEAGRGAGQEARFQRLQQAILETFEEMNQVLAGERFEFNVRDPKRWVVTFLSEFDAIFSLNQDLFLEMHYVPGKMLPEMRKWRATAYPGVALPANWLDCQPVGRLNPVLTVGCDVAHDPQDQPIYKLHGSVNWRTADGSRVLVIGEGKEASIRDNSLLSGYLGKFRECLSAGKTKLMIVGYSFSDDHVNDLLEEASERSGLQTYLVNPAGLSIFDPPPNALITYPSKVFTALRLAGISTRPFRDAFESDDLVFKSFLRFLCPKR